MTNFTDVGEFMIAGEQTVHQIPMIPTEKDIQLRIKLMREELAEVEQAIAEQNLEHIAKELADLLYVVYGTGHSFGINLDMVFEEVHHSNLTKFVDGKLLKNEHGKGIKGPNYKPADITAVFLKQSAQLLQYRV